MKIPYNQNAALYKDIGDILIKSIPINNPVDDECLIKVHRTGICGSDLHTFRGNSTRNTFENWIKLGFADGHEYCGTIVSIGENVQKFHVGDRVVAECTRHCGNCNYCKIGLYNICMQRKDLVWRGHGGFAEFATAPEHALYKINNNISDVQAAMIEPAACAYRAISRTNITKDQSILVIGAGSIGLLCAGIFKALGYKNITISAKYKSQIKVAENIGIEKICYPNELKSEITDVVIDSVGTEISFNSALLSVKRSGQIIIVGSPVKNSTIKLGNIVGKELTIKGSLTYALEHKKSDFKSTINLFEEGKFDASHLVTHTYELNNINQAFKTALNKSSNSIKVQIVYN